MDPGLPLAFFSFLYPLISSLDDIELERVTSGEDTLKDLPPDEDEEEEMEVVQVEQRVEEDGEKMQEEKGNVSSNNLDPRTLCHVVSILKVLRLPVFI